MSAEDRKSKETDMLLIHAMKIAVEKWFEDHDPKFVGEGTPKFVQELRTEIVERTGLQFCDGDWVPRAAGEWYCTGLPGQQWMLLERSPDGLTRIIAEGLTQVNAERIVSLTQVEVS